MRKDAGLNIHALGELRNLLSVDADLFTAFGNRTHYNSLNLTTQFCLLLEFLFTLQEENFHLNFNSARGKFAKFKFHDYSMIAYIIEIQK